MAEQRADSYMDQIRAVIQVCEDTDGILIVDRDGIIRDHRIAMNYYWKAEETVGRHIRELYPELDGESSTILRALRTGQAVYDQRQEIVNSRGERVVLDATTIPVVAGGHVVGAVDCARFYVVGQRIVRGGRRGGLSTLDRIITRSPRMEELKRRVRSAAQLDSPVLIYGETGTGKELVAEALHSEGRRCGSSFVSQNCAAIPANLLESIFFGTEKGSYTGAVTRRGLFEEADGGTLFLDEINSMHTSLQAKLLKALEEKKARRIGGGRDTPFDVRVVAAVNEPPEELLRTGRLREDLYYRLGVVRLSLPPLRERPEDIPLLTAYFIEQYNRSMKRKIRGVTPEVAERFQRFGWPGNIRQLRNVVEGAFAVARGEYLSIEDIGEGLAGWSEGSQAGAGAPSQRSPSLPEAPISLSREVERYERELIRQAMERWGSISAAARHLGLSRQSLKYKLQKYDL